jgi:hypothetical protein
MMAKGSFVDGGWSSQLTELLANHLFGHLLARQVTWIHPFPLQAARAPCVLRVYCAAQDVVGVCFKVVFGVIMQCAR